MTDPPDRHPRDSGDGEPGQPEPAEEFEALLRSAMHDEVDGIIPAGDGLRRIQDGVERRRRRRIWVRPGLALAAAAAVAVAIVVPTMLRGDGAGRQTAGSAPTPTAPGTTRPTTPAPSSSSGATASPSLTGGPSPGLTSPTHTRTPTTPGGSATTRPVRTSTTATVWPGPTLPSATGNPSGPSGRDLTDPGRTAVDFLASYFGGITFESSAPTRAGGTTLVTLTRKDTGGTVTTVHLVSASVGRSTVYAVRSATADSLTLDQLPTVSGIDPFAVGGRVDIGSSGGAEPYVNVQLRAPAALNSDGSNRVPTAGTSEQAWTANLSAGTPLAGTGVVAAWTSGNKNPNDVIRFVAGPTA
ncbi:MAG: hypothetical protein ACR2JQ_12360 [Mycobacteriales bacterium]